MHRECHSIFILKLEWKRTFLCISISFQNWKLKMVNSFSIFNFQFLFEYLKKKTLVFRFSIFILFQNAKLRLIKLTLILSVHPCTKTSIWKNENWFFGNFQFNFQFLIISNNSIRFLVISNLIFIFFGICEKLKIANC